jgi:hypothetical protein
VPSGPKTLALLAAFAILPLAAHPQPNPAAPGRVTARTPASPRSIDMGLRFELEPNAIAMLKATSDRLAAAKTLRFTAVATYESPARTGQPLAYTVRSEVTLERPNKLRVTSPGDGPASEYYYDGTTVAAYSPSADLVAVATAPPTLDEMLKAAYDIAGIYFPFADFIVADPYKDLSEGLKLAFVVGQSQVVGDTTTNIIVLANDTVQAQLWIGAEDHLPRMMRATYFDEPGNFRHQIEFSHWVLDEPVPPGTFTAEAAANAKRIRFGGPDTPPEVADNGGKKP